MRRAARLAARKTSPAATILTVMTRSPDGKPEGSGGEPPAGKPAAIDWQAALAEHGRWLRTVVLSRLGEPQAVDEVMQEVSLAAVEQRAPLTDPTKVAAW